MSKTSPGVFLSIDGVDGAGKSTQILRLRDWYQEHGRAVSILRDPGGTKLGEALRDILLHRQEIPLCMTAEMLLYMASRAQLVQEVILPALADGQVVIADRFLLANVVYQGSGGGLNTDTIWNVGEIATQQLVPDLTFVLDLDPKVSLSRLQGGLDRLESRGLEYMQKVREGFLHESHRLGRRAMVIDANQGIEEIHAQIVAAVSARE